MTQSQHIMIVDDEAPAREMVGDYLKMHGFGVTLCDGGKSLRVGLRRSGPGVAYNFDGTSQLLGMLPRLQRGCLNASGPS